ncbi:nickel-dependent hydrogenase large subunit [candidate division FCPU426 bacterium]|nr:nickel-dependent hydrogenase large subunit [candidate division FCPU426 bacterium]
MATSETKTHSPIKTVIGPIHPALKEPIKFIFEIEGEKISKVDLAPGHNHRGLEWMATRRNPVQILYVAERICGICSIAHSLTFCRAIEQAAAIETPARADYVRTIFAELERIHSHLLWAGVAALELGFDTLFYKTWEVREDVMDLLEYLSGNRVNYGIMQIGGVRRDITPAQHPRIRKSLLNYTILFDELVNMFLEDSVLRMRCRDTGLLTREEALQLCTVGPTQRASGVAADVRQDNPYCAYGDLRVKAVTPDQLLDEVRGDVFDRIIVRLLEVKQSVDIIAQCLETLPDGPLLAIPKIMVLLNHLKKAEGEGIGRHEAPRGEVFHYLRLTADRESPAAWKVKASTYSNLLSWIKMLQGEQVADIPIIVASVDPCISCTDRVAVIKQGKTAVYTQEDLRRISREKTRRLRQG